MNCDADCDWGEEASIFFSYIEDSKVIKVNLCKYCANEKGIDDPTGYSLIDLMQGMGQETSSEKPNQNSNELTCENCGFTQTDFKKTGRFGCAKCYEVFNEGLETLLEAMHKNTEHAGKIPSFVNEGSLPTAPVLKDDELDFGPTLDTIDESGFTEQIPASGINIEILKDKLDIAISEEDYEEAARIRDQITKLELANGENG